MFREIKSCAQFGLWFVLLLTALPAAAAQFQLNTLIQLGEVGANAPNGWEVGFGSNTGTLGFVGSLPTYWVSGGARNFQLSYDRPTNLMEVRIYDPASTTAYAFGTFTPTGGPSVVGSAWVLPAASFFVTDLTGGNAASSISVSGLALTGITGGALSILSPIQQTTMTASATGPASPTQTVTQSKDVVFLADATGSWRLTGAVTMNFAGLTGSNFNRLQLGIAAVTATPEPATWAMLLVGLALVGIGKRGRFLGGSE
jgi:PEP-CTERM motif